MGDDREIQEEGPAGQSHNGIEGGQRSGGAQAGGGPSPADRSESGGSSGTGGYGRAQNQELAGQAEAGGDELAEDQAAHQDRGQSLVEDR